MDAIVQHLHFQNLISAHFILVANFQPPIYLKTGCDDGLGKKRAVNYSASAVPERR